MDRENFNLVDTAFQQDLQRHYAELENKLAARKAEYAQSMGDTQDDIDRGNQWVEKEIQKEREEKQSEIYQTLSFAHFPEIGRDQVLAQVELEEQQQQNDPQASIEEQQEIAQKHQEDEERRRLSEEAQAQDNIVANDNQRANKEAEYDQKMAEFRRTKEQERDDDISR